MTNYSVEKAVVDLKEGEFISSGNILSPGDNLVVRAVNESSNAGDVSIDLDFIKMNNGP